MGRIAEHTRGCLNPDLLLVLLEVSRSGRYTDAGGVLGLNHTTVARKIGVLEAVGGSSPALPATDTFSAYVEALGEQVVRQRLLLTPERVGAAGG